jgi:4-amino-4-deoxy-L-arabinose transferase-like glycosyltransferase
MVPRGLVLVVALAVLVPLAPLVANRFHHDEAIYSSWGLDIASGRDIMVSGSPVDKPPLFLYLQALSFVLLGATETAARLPSLASSAVSVVLIYCIGQRLYGRGSGLLAAFLLAASPFGILFAATAFTDPMMVSFVLAACLAAAAKRWGWAGVLLGLASMTKQQGLLFLPLVVGLGCRASPSCGWFPRARSTSTTGICTLSALWRGAVQCARRRGRAMRFATGLGLVLGLILTWDLARGRQPGFLEQSLLSYSALSLQPAMVWQRLWGFLNLLRHGTGSSLLNCLLVGGLPLLLLFDCVALFRPNTAHDRGVSAGRQPAGRSTRLHGVAVAARTAAAADLILVAFTALFLIGHSLASFQVWDRYLLGLIPLLALLLARVLTLPRQLWYALHPLSVPRSEEESESGTMATPWQPRVLTGLVMLVTLSTTAGPIRDAAGSRLPVGGDHGAYDGIEQVVDYFKAVPADTTIYHRWLGSHWRFYLWGSPYDMRRWTSPADLAAQAAARAGARRYVVFPSWRSSTEARLALEQAGLKLREVYRTLRRDGSVSFVVYRIQEVQ